MQAVIDEWDRLISKFRRSRRAVIEDRDTDGTTTDQEVIDLDEPTDPRIKRSAWRDDF
jgi:hypothetical protein